jgi:pimeloyl-ACP methyl ester carboxylesterase
MRFKLLSFRFIFSLSFLFFSNLSFAYNPQEIGMVLLHGKWGIPPGPLADKFMDEGYRVVSPTMPWSRDRNYDATYEQNLEDIHQIVQKLRLEGSKLVILGGLSFGANAVLAYLSKYQDVDGAMIFSPGHLPERFYERGLTTTTVDNARALIQSGQGSLSFTFTDYNQGRNRDMTSTASIYLSYYDPNGLANMPKSASSIHKSIPFLCVMSSAELILGKDYIFSKLPIHPLSKYIETTASHMQAPDATYTEASKFMQSLINP